MKILIASHDKEVGYMYSEIASMNGHSVITPKEGEYSAQRVLDMLKERPDKVLMDINYGRPGTENIQPILQVAETMRSLNYDLQKSLLGVTGRDDLVGLVQREHNIPTISKTDMTRTMEFLS